MLVEEIYRSNMRYTHQSVEFMEVYNYLRGIDETKFRGHFENSIYSKTMFFREFYNNPLKTDKEKSEEKSKEFQAAIFQGTFTGNCHAKEILTLSGLLVLDIDHLNKEELKRVCEILKRNDTVFCYFISPSQEGLKVLIKHNLTIDKVASDWKWLYKEVSNYYAHLTRTPENFDEKTSDVSRICYLPYCSENDIYLNKNSKVWNYCGTCKPVYVEYEYEEVEIDDKQYQYWNDLADYLLEHSLDVADSYSEWLSLGYSLATIGELGRDIYHKVSSVSPKYNSDDTENRFDECLATLDENRTTIFHYVKVANDAIEYYLSLLSDRL